MLVIVATFRAKPGKREELLAEAKALIARTRLEAGCINFRLLEDPYETGSFLIFEEWADAAALAAHSTTPHVNKWKQKALELREGQPGITRYQTEKSNSDR